MAKARAGKFLQEYGVLIALVLLFAFSAIKQPGVFLAPENLRNLINQNVAIGIIAIGMTLVIILGGIDLSVGSMMALAAGLAVLAMNKFIAGGGSEATAVWLALGVGVGAATLMGLVNGLITAYGRIAPFIVTLAGLAGYRSIILAIADGGEIRSSSMEAFPALARGGIVIPGVTDGVGRPLLVTWGIIAFVIVALLAGFLLNRTSLGRQIVAVGANETAARYSAVATNRIKVATYALLGVTTGLAAIFNSSRFNAVSSAQSGLYFELDAIAAVVIGGTAMTGGRGRIWGTVAGVLILAIITNMLTTSNVSTYWQGLVKGLIILVAVLIQRGRAAP
jgi:ribose transport system permease protein